MNRRRLILALLFLAFGGWAAGASPAGAQEGDDPARMMTLPDRLGPPQLPAHPTQADLGAQVFYLYCMACHGDRGQGLTDEWRSAWAEGDQNCWQSRCHSPNHPPGGFILPRAVPAVIGEQRLTHFGDAATLHTYLQQRMPWHMPGSLDEEQYWQLTAYLTRANGLTTDLPLLTAANAADVRFGPAVAPPAVAPPADARWRWPALLVLLTAIVAGLLLRRRGRG